MIKTELNETMALWSGIEALEERTQRLSNELRERINRMTDRQSRHAAGKRSRSQWVRFQEILTQLKQAREGIERNLILDGITSCIKEP